MDEALGVDVDERRTITVPVPANNDVLSDLACAFADAANDGFTVVAGSARDDGNQRDPTVKAVVIVLRKTAS